MANSAKEVMQALETAHVGDRRTFSRRTGEFCVRRGYFYRMGMTTEKLVEAVKAAVPAAKIIKAVDRYAAWPHDSYFEVRFVVPEATVLR